jgi:hypothetical protein
MSASPLSRIGLPSDDGTASAPTGNRKAVLGIAGLLAAGLALGASLLLGGDPDELEELGAPPAAAAAEPTASASESASPAPLEFPDDSAARDGRDPFAALYVEPTPGAGAAATGAPAPDAGTPGAAAPDAGAPAPGVPAVPAAGAAGGAPGTGAEPPSVGTGALTIALLRTEGSDPSRTAVFTVDGAEVPVAVGESFGPSDGLLLLSLQQGPAADGWTAVVQSGQGEPFDVVTGVPVAVP